MIFDYIKNDAVITEFKRIVKKSRFNEPDLKAFIDEGIRKILPEKGNKDFMIAVRPIKDREVLLPNDFACLTQFPLYTTKEDNIQDLEELDEFNDEVTFEKCICNVPDECDDKKWRLEDFRCDNHCILDILFHRNFVKYEEYSLERPEWGNLDEGAWYLMRPRINNFSNLKYHLGKCTKYSVPNSIIEYEMVSNQKMTVNVDDGYVLLSYLAHKKDKDGYFLIPDDPFVIDALKHYLIQQETLGIMIEQRADGHNKGMWRDMVSLTPRKMLAAKAQMKNENLNRINLLLETSWHTLIYNRDVIGGYKPPLDFYPKI